jgi:hypothetical protein
MLAVERVTREKQNNETAVINVFTLLFGNSRLRKSGYVEMGQGKMEGNRLYIKFVTVSPLGLTEDEYLSEPVESALMIDCWKSLNKSKPFVATFADCSPAITNGGYVRGVRNRETIASRYPLDVI